MAEMFDSNEEIQVLESEVEIREMTSISGCLEVRRFPVGRLIASVSSCSSSELESLVKIIGAPG